jgi:hypothetical protein
MLDEKSWEKNGALGGIIFVVLSVVGALIGGALPSRTDPAAEIAEWFSDNDSAIQLGAFLTVVGVVGLAWWFGSLWRSLTTYDDGSERIAVIALVGLVVSGVGAMGAFMVNAGAAATIDILGEGSAIFFSIASVGYALGAMGNAITSLAVSAHCLRSGFLPQAVGGFGVLVAVANAIASIGIASDAEFFGIFGFISFLAFAAWILAVSVTLYQKIGARQAAAA